MSINWNTAFQTMDGFGTSQAGFAQTLNGLAEPQRTQILDLAFSQALGIGLDMFRVQIRPCFNPSAGVFDYSNNNCLNPPGTPNPPGPGTADLSAAAQVELAKEASWRGPVKNVATAWSPPAWMKDNGSIVGGQLLGSHYQNFATYLSRFVKEYAAANGISFYAVSLANEPNAAVSWDSCFWTSWQIATFLANYLSPTFATNSVTAKVIAPETSNWDLAESFLADTYNNATARSRLDIAAGHLYEGDPAHTFPLAGGYPGVGYEKKIWQTEASINYGTVTISDALGWARTIHNSLTSAQVSGWIWWLLYLWPSDQSIIHSSGGGFTTTKTFWALGNFSKFVRPGFVRISATNNGVNLSTSAFKDPATGQLVIVAVNESTTATSANFSASGVTLGSATPFVTSATQNLQPQAPVSLAGSVSIPARSVVTYVSTPYSAFNVWANAPNARALGGDFNGDGFADIALAGGDGWTSVPVALGLGNGRFNVTNYGLWDFASWANAPGVKLVVGDFNGDGRDDISVTGGPGWYTVPIAFSNGNGSFTTSNLADANIPTLSQAPGVKVLAGDVNNDGKDDLVLTGGPSWSTIPVGFSQGNGTFTLTNYAVANFPTWAQDPNAKATATDVNGDGRVDLMLTGGATWFTVPTAVSNGNGTFTVYNQSVANIPTWAQGPGAKPIAGCRRTVARAGFPNDHRCDANTDQRGDLMLTGGAGWVTVPLALANGNGTFNVSNPVLSEFPIWARESLAQAVSGDFNGDRKTDIALVGGNEYVGSGRWTVPIAYSSGAGAFTYSNYPIN